MHRVAASFALVIVALAGCSSGDGGGASATIKAEDVASCLTAERGVNGWTTLPASERAHAVYAIDFGPNSVMIYVEPDAAAVAAEITDIRKAELEVGNTSPGQQVILRKRGNVLVSWSSAPTAEQRAPVERCASVA